MGSLFSSPSPPPPPPAPVIHTPEPADEDRKARLKALERRRRGRAGLIATSDRGVANILGDEVPGNIKLGDAEGSPAGTSSAVPPPKKRLGA